MIRFGVAALEAQSAPLLHVVAAENFYGDIARQIGGDRVSVTSIMSDPNIDPHQYESNVHDAKALSSADLVIENGGGYDDWIVLRCSVCFMATKMSMGAAAKANGFPLRGVRW
jgi:ABC-type Zn uptake system ZnuABC Zn-binding protein ZnuA